MRLVGLVIGLVGLVVVAIGGALWAVVMMAPTCVIIGIIIFVLIRADRKLARQRNDLEHEATRQRLLNEQEYDAWRKAVEDDRRADERRRRALRKFDSTRDQPGN